MNKKKVIDFSHGSPLKLLKLIKTWLYDCRSFRYIVKYNLVHLRYLNRICLHQLCQSTETKPCLTVAVKSNPMINQCFLLIFFFLNEPKFFLGNFDIFPLNMSG